MARELLRRDPATEIRFVGTATGIEAGVVPREGFALDLIRVAGLKGKSRADRLKGFLMLPLATIDAWRLLSRIRPDVVVGVGGFASGPVLAFAALRRFPTMLLEQNALPGVTNRLLAPMVRAAAVNFEEALKYFPRTGFVAGNPVRPEFFTATGEESHDKTARPFDSVGSASGTNLAQGRVLIFGGSQGAHAINVAMVAAASRLAATGLELAITHQTGERDLGLVRGAYEHAGLQARVEAYIFEIDGEMKAADLVICRSGATTLAELTAAGRAAILVPLPNSTDDHQRKNAEVLGRAGAALVIEERELHDRLAKEIAALVGDRARLAKMKEISRSMAKPDAAARIADRVEVLGGKRAR